MIRSWWGALGALVIGAGALLLALDIEAWNTAWFLFAWYGYLLVLDAFTFRVAGRSHLASRPRALAVMMLWSVPFWSIFEAYNLVLRTWYYAFLPHGEAAQAAFAFAAFATVLPACFFPAELLGALGLWETSRSRPLRVTRTFTLALGGLGVLCLTLPLLWPRGLFWMIWGGCALPAAINHATGGDTLLRDLEHGRPARPLRLLAGGLLAGAAWEAFNFPARARWVYTVPGFEELKLFEMPLLGFAGFPVLSLFSFEAYALIRRELRGTRAMAAIVIFSLGAQLVTMDSAVLSRRPLLEELEGIDAAGASRLRALGAPTPERLCRLLTADGLSQVALESGVAEVDLDRALRHAGLALHKGIGTAHARALLGAGVREVSELSRLDAIDLQARLASRATGAAQAPSLAEVRAWIRGARTSWFPGVSPGKGRDCR